MRKITAALLLSFALNAQATTENRAHENRPYTFDYFVHVDSGPKPTLIFGTGQTTFIQLSDGVEVQQIQVRKGKTQKNAEIFYSAPYTVVKELHDSLKVVTNKGAFTAERSGAKTEVELAAERAEIALKERQEAEAKAKEQAALALKEREAAEAKAKEQAAEIAKLRDELKAKQELAETKNATSGQIAAAPTISADQGAPQIASPNPGKPGVRVNLAAVSMAPVERVYEEAAAAASYEIQIRNGEGLRAALARESAKLGVKLSWSLREDRVASRDMFFSSTNRDEILNEILVAFRLPGYLVHNTGTLYIVKD